MKRKVLFVCVGNAARSQMAEAFAKTRGLMATSAGIHPASMVSRDAVEVMREKGFDLSMSKPKGLTAKMIEDADVIVDMGCPIKEICPAPLIVNLRKKLIEWNIEDPLGMPLEMVRRIRNEIESKVDELDRLLRTK